MSDKHVYIIIARYTDYDLDGEKHENTYIESASLDKLTIKRKLSEAVERKDGHYYSIEEITLE